MITHPIQFPSFSMTAAGVSFTRPTILEKKAGVKIAKSKV
jgi:hypothetical protein